MDFLSEKELVTQTGHDIAEWPLVIVKELVDNALDACEEADIAPVIDVMADASHITVADNGPGLPDSTLAGVLDFTIRASNREAYVAPDRGQQGNALKTIVPMPVVIDPEYGKLVIKAHGKRHVISCGCDAISQRPVVNDDVATVPTRGTSVTIEWRPRTLENGNVFWPFGDSLLITKQDRRDPVEDELPRRFVSIVEGFALFNPHATFHLDWFGRKKTWPATNPTWDKWKASKPTSPYWYEIEHLERLIGAYITHDRAAGKDRLVNDFIAEFDGLTGSQKRTKVLTETGLKRVPLSGLVVGDHLDSERIGRLLKAMRKHTRPVKPQRLGLIGEDHLKTRLLAMGIKPESFRYRKKLDGLGCWSLLSAG
jgi:hypothetical protein